MNTPTSNAADARSSSTVVFSLFATVQHMLDDLGAE
jgi:hypothetical protein